MNRSNFNQSDNKLEKFAFVFLLAFFILASCLHFLTGYADNGDFSRSIGFLFERPSGFSSMWPAEGTEEWTRRYFTQWHPRWVYLPTWPDFNNIDSLSSYKLYVTSQAGLSTIATGNRFEYSIIAGSVLSRLILGSAYVLCATFVRREIDLFAGWLLAVTFGLLIVDTSWMAFLNSFYEEQIAVVFLPVMAFFLLRAANKLSTTLGIALLLLALLIGSAKTIYFYLPTLVVIALLLLKPTKKQLGIFLAVGLISQAIALVPVAYGKYERINSYHALYYGALTELPDERKYALLKAGNEIEFGECIGVAAFSGEGEACMSKTDASYGHVARLLISEPTIVVGVADRLLREGKLTALQNLSKSTSSDSGFNHVKLFNVWPIVFSLGANYMFLIFIPLLIVTLIKMARSTCKPDEFCLLFVALFFGLFGCSQYAAAFGDGFYEITKHLAVGNYSLALSISFGIPLFIAFVLRRARKLPQRTITD